MGESAEVRIKLVADDASAATIEKVKGHLHGVEEQAAKAGESTGGIEMAGTAATGAMALLAGGVAVMGAALYESYEFASMLGEAALEAANNALEETNQMKGLFTLMDGGKHTMEDLGRYAEGMHEELAGSAADFGVTAKQMTDAYDALIERGNISTEQAKDLADNMAIVGKITKGGMEGLAQGFSMMEMGIIRARNPVVQLIAATHTLQGNAHAVAAAMQKMSPEEQIKIAEAAIAKQADLMKSGGALGGLENLDTLRTSFMDIREQFLEAVGKPMLDKLIPQLTSVKNYLIAHIDTILKWGDEIGEYFGQFVDVMSEIFTGIYQAVTENWEDIVAFGKMAAEPLSDVWHWIYDHRKEIGDTLKTIVSDTAAIMKWIMDTMKTATDYLTEAMKAIPGMEVKMAKGEAGREHLAMVGSAGQVGAGSDDALAKQIADYAKVARAAGKSDEEIQAVAKSMTDVHTSAQQAAKSVDESLSQGNILAYGDYINKAIQHHDQGAEDYAISLLRGSDLAQRELAQGTLQIEGGFDDFVKMLDDKSPELAKRLRGMHDAIKSEGGLKGMGPSINFNNNTFHVNQSFRDENADRVMFAFRKDILKSAESRRQSRVGTPFGL